VGKRYRSRAGLALVAILLSVRSAAAQEEHTYDVSLNWSPAFADNVAYRILPAWSLSWSGPDHGGVSLAVDVGGWYFPNAQSIHNLLAGPRIAGGAEGVRPFAQVLAGASIWFANNAAAGLAIVPGGGADIPVGNGRFAVRLEGDYFGMYAPGDYGRHYWGHVWRFSTGVVLVTKHR
jgi:hypothetical protein